MTCKPEVTYEVKVEQLINGRRSRTITKVYARKGDALNYIERLKEE